MISTTWTTASADLLGLGGLDVRPVDGSGLCSGVADRAVARPAAPAAPARETGLPTGSTAVRLRPATRRAFGHEAASTDVDVVTTDFFDTNGTTLGIHSSRRPQS